MSSSRRVTIVLAYVLYFTALFGVSAKLFFEPQFDAFVKRFTQASILTQQTLTLGLAEPLTSMNPFANDAGSRNRLLHIYEGLTRITGDLDTEPALALSYGSLDANTWEFRLRPGVVFHNGKSLEVEDVISSLDRAAHDLDSGVKDFVSTIKSVEKIDERTLHIITNTPDPLLATKLSYIFIIPAEIQTSVLVTQPIGTGPFHFKKEDAGIFTVDRFEKYWGSPPLFAEVVIKTLQSKQERVAALTNHEVDLLSSVPADSAAKFRFEGFRLEHTASLEVNFLLFNFTGIFKNKALRQAVLLALDTEELARYTDGFATAQSQFVRTGIFGYDPTIPDKKVDRAQAKKLAADGFAASLSGVVRLDLPRGLEGFGKKVSEHLAAAGIKVEVIYYAPDEYSKRILAGKSPFYFFGWKSDLGDSLDFLTSVIHSSRDSYGTFNGMHYANSAVDALIEESAQELTPKLRLEKMRQVMRTITTDDVIGVPLFSPEMLFAVSNKLVFKPRVDGYLLAQDIKS